MSRGEGPTPRERNPLEKSLLWRGGQALCRLYTSCLMDLKVHGTRHIPPAGGVLIVSNHQSFLDPVILAVQLRRPMSYLARDTLFRNPAFAWLIRNLNAVPIGRGTADLGAMKETIRRLQEGHMLTIFPEGTRTEDGEIRPLHSGVGLVIRRAGVPVIPAVVDGSFEAWPKGAKLPRPHPLRVMYGRELEFGKLKPDEIIAKVRDTLKTMLTDLRSGNLAPYR